MVPVMSEEQLKAAETEATAEQEEGSGEEISEEDLAGVAGGKPAQDPTFNNVNPYWGRPS